MKAKSHQLAARGITNVALALLQLAAVRQLPAQGTVTFSFDGPPYVGSGTARIVQSYEESGMSFTPIDPNAPWSGFGMRNSVPGVGWPYNGTTFVQADLTATLKFSFGDGSVFDLIAVDLAGYSDVVPDDIARFVGYRHDGTVVTTDFQMSDLLFRTYAFGPEFRNLDRVEVPTWGSLDNLVVGLAEPSAPGVLLMNANDRGWYDSTGYHSSTNDDYFCGESGGLTYRNWFVFNVPPFAGVICGADLQINSYSNSPNTSPAGRQNYELREVTASIATLEAGGSGLTNIYSDLADGTVYGSRNFGPSDSGTTVTIPLNDAFRAAAVAANGQIALGGNITTLDPTPDNEYLFAGSVAHVASDAQLRLTITNTVVINAARRGWYDSTGFHDPANANYIAGTGTAGGVWRNWFAFDMPHFAGDIVQAELLLNCYSNQGPGQSQSYVLRQVTTSVAALEAGGSGLTNIFNDLGDGAVYAMRNVLTAESGRRAILPLNAAFISAASAVQGGQIALGGSVANPGGAPADAYLFGFSGLGLADDVQLRLTFGHAVTVSAAAQGWYDQTGYHDPSYHSYIVGSLAGYTLRDFFVFYVPRFLNELVSAQLLIQSYSNASPDGAETYQLHEVTAPITTLTNGGTGLTAIYEDLADGTLYGERPVFVSEQGGLVCIPLNGYFLRQAAGGGQDIALGGSISTLGTSNDPEVLFGNSGHWPDEVQLRLCFAGDWPPSPRFAPAQPLPLGANTYRLMWTGTAGHYYELDASFDSENWHVVAQVLMSGTSASYDYADSSPLPRFFRVRLLP
jgi:hypothetical protein